MSQQNNSAREQLLTLEKLAKKVIRKSLKDNTLDYTVQITVSSLEPGKLKYAAQISSPAKGVEPITYIFDNYDALEASLIKSATAINRTEVEKTFHQSRINTYKNKIQQHEARLTIISDPKYDPDNEDIEMEEV